MIDVHRRVMVDIGLLHFAFLFIVFRFFLRSNQLKKNTASTSICMASRSSKLSSRHPESHSATVSGGEEVRREGRGGGGFEDSKDFGVRVLVAE